MQVPTCVPPHHQRRPPRRRADRDFTAPVTFAPGVPGYGPGPLTPEQPQPRVCRWGRMEGDTNGPPTILPGAPQLLAGPAVCAGAQAASRPNQPLGPRPQRWLAGHPRGEGLRGAGDSSCRSNSNSRRAPMRPGADGTLAPPFLNSDLHRPPGGGQFSGPPPPTNPDKHRAARGPTEPTSHPLKGAASP